MLFRSAGGFPQSPVKRAGFRGFLRNVIISLGNSSAGTGLEHLDRLAQRADIQDDALLSGTLERARRRLLKKTSAE